MSSFESPIDDDRREQSSKRQPERTVEGVVPTGCALRSLAAHQLERLTISNVNQRLFISVLTELAPEIPEACGEYLFEVFSRGEAICPHTVVSSYFGSAPYLLEHTLVFEIGEGQADERHQHLCLEKQGAHDSLPLIKLSRRNGQIDLELDLSAETLKEEWSCAERIGDAIGITALPGCFTRAPLELEYFEDDCVRVSISEDVVVRTTLRERSLGFDRHECITKDRQTTKSVWLPCSLYVKDMERDDLRTVFALIDPQQGEAIAESGFFELGELFVSEEAPSLSMADVREMASSLAFKVHMSVHRSVSLGYVEAPLAGEQETATPDTHSSDQEDDELVVSWDVEGSSDDLLEEVSGDNEWSDEDLGEVLEWSPDEDERPFCSRITLRGVASSGEGCSIGLTSRPAVEGHCSSIETPSDARTYERDGLFGSVVFEDGGKDIRPNDAAKRFALVREAARRLGVSKFPARGRFDADLNNSRRQAILEGMNQDDDFGVDYFVGRVMVHVKRFVWPIT